MEMSALLLAWRSLRDAGQQPQDDGGAEDDGAGALQEDLGAADKAEGNVLGGGQLIFGKLHHEAAAAALEDPAAKDERGEQRTDNPGDVEPEHDQPLEADAEPQSAGSG